MSGAKVQGPERPLEPLGYEALEACKTIEQLSPFERRTSWTFMDHSGQESIAALRSGIHLCASSCTWEQPLSIGVAHLPSQIDFLVSRGPGMRATTEHGDTYVLAGGTVQVGQVKRPVRLCYDSTWDAHDEVVSISIDEERLNELLGATVLPSSLRRILSKAGPYPLGSLPMTPALFRLLDEILYCDAMGVSRQLYLEGKGLELLALMVDRFEEAERAESPRLCPSDVDRLQRARKILLARLTAPPSLPELARLAGLNEAKLKSGFRTLFGSSVFAYLRRHRMEAARRLLRGRRYNVTEVAMRVGYSNPSKFASAFRKHFGVSPSAVA